ncbi:multiple cyclophane-containing RiPP AmcA [Micromonospora sp. NPDC051196]|uniref:multiple cyclophane-containing RiPP AmcA n=1 Tax=Micromonospora sp. NPDC051196 TaxID=3155281 RepID=UPI003435C2EA
MPETISHRESERATGEETDQVVSRVREAAAGLAALLHEADVARQSRAEVTGGDGASAVCAWNHFENIPTFYNWNNRPR